MSVREFKSRLALIRKFIIEMNKETVPESIQKIIVKIYAANLNLHLTDKMIDDIV
ncbi:hypothetical protein CLHOM_33460 [Clostridium homopropionicum DSM 5847]|uniref:Uncharacterized protein n=1 Tax=Clostridium homopropionicum DSM 5847 TaxID=1121318 RepID=A0A0L6Z645_9CLOT|nr:hypothetical protein [Clostridium homopropionicum]KOA18444.1 hypothetical protein CLHOM_33460 [Clostridium homopropionicum DSM 5847]SFF66703.1 hypothetical protein SAMN04488501_101134 [Clostridium homopropionicum]